MKAEGSLLKAAQHTDGMDRRVSSPSRAEPSRGFLCFTKFVKCCAALNKRLNRTVNLLSRSGVSLLYKVSERLFSFFTGREEIVSLFLQFECLILIFPMCSAASQFIRYDKSRRSTFQELCVDPHRTNDVPL